MTGCPGRDRSAWTADDIFDVACPDCGTLVEFFKDDGRRDCPSCGRCVVNPRRAQSCAQWCGSAERCSLGRGLAAETAPEAPGGGATETAPEAPGGGATETTPEPPTGAAHAAG